VPGCSAERLRELKRLPRYLVTVEYSGTDFHGFQKQPGLSTVQGEMESAITRFTGEDVRVMGCGRTDTGVHALGQAAAFDLSREVDIPKAFNSLNALLPRGIAVTKMVAARDGFDPRRDALWREYRYFILNRRAPSPVLEDYTHHVAASLDVELMARACGLFTGEHDFSAFRVKGSTEESSVREVLGCDFTYARADILCFRVRANAFLYRMVRIMAGAVKAVGCARMSLGELDSHLEGGDMPCAAPLPACGLFLWMVEYPAGTEVE
jgi:tRNA pseudouridine38-40 synthase